MSAVWLSLICDSHPFSKGSWLFPALPSYVELSQLHLTIHDMILSCMSPLTAQHVVHKGVIGELIYALEVWLYSLRNRCECFERISGKEFQLPNVSGTRLDAEFVLQKNVLDDVIEQTSYPAAIFDDTLLLETLSEPPFPLVEFVTGSGQIYSGDDGCSFPDYDFKRLCILRSSGNPVGFFVSNPLKKLRRDVGPQFSAHGSMLVGQFSPEDSVFNFRGKYCCSLCKMPSHTNEALAWHIGNNVRTVVKEEPVDLGPW
ncbi:hypothetical protein Drorol1_Dr00001609 [Drosera rotundifolia]